MSIYTPVITSRQVARLISDMRLNGGLLIKSKYIVDAILASPKGHHITARYVKEDRLYHLKYSTKPVRPKADTKGSGG